MQIGLFDTDGNELPTHYLRFGILRRPTGYRRVPAPRHWGRSGSRLSGTVQFGGIRGLKKKVAGFTIFKANGTLACPWDDHQPIRYRGEDTLSIVVKLDV
jgi:hypothetical protein